MSTSFGKKLKINNSASKMIEKQSQEFQSPPLSTQDPNFWLDDSDLSWLSDEIEQEIDKVLQIAKPQPLKIKQNIISSGNDIREELSVNNKNTKRNSLGLDNQQDLEKNIKIKNKQSFKCEFPIKKNESEEQVQNRENFEDDQNRNINQDQQERNFLFQGDMSFVKCKNQNNKQKQKKQNTIKHIIDFSFSQQEQQNNSYEEDILGFCQFKNSKLKERIYEDIPSPQFYQEKTKELQIPQDLEKPNFKVNLNWKRNKNRREARKYEQYQTQEFQHLSLFIADFYVHEKEGELKIDKLKKMQNDKTRFYQVFELKINPTTVIGPMKLSSYLKLFIRFKKGYFGQVYCNQNYTETIPIKEYGKVFENEKKLFLVNNSSHIVKLICCLIKKIQNPKKLNLC